MSVAGVAHPVERHLAKVEVASSSLVTRSIKPFPFGNGFLFYPAKARTIQSRGGALPLPQPDGMEWLRFGASSASLRNQTNTQSLQLSGRVTDPPLHFSWKKTRSKKL